MTRTILGLHYGHDSNCCLLREGEAICGIAEERLSRNKLHSGFPFLSLAWVLEQSGCRPEEIDKVAVVGIGAQDETLGGYYAKMRERMGKRNTAWTRLISDFLSVTDNLLPYVKIRRAVARRMVLDELHNAGFPSSKVVFVDHHLAHAASAFYSSGWKAALILTIDGKGDKLSHRTCIGRNGQIEELESSSDVHSMGFFYSVITEFLGFKRLQHEGKITGLAAYGDREMTTHLRTPVRYDPERHRFVNTLMTAKEERFTVIIYWRLLRQAPAFLWRLLRTSANIQGRYSQYLIDQFCRTYLSNFQREHVAAFAQRCLEEEVVALVKDALVRTKETHLCAAGGTFANVRLNQKISELPGLKNVYIQPAMGDGGLSLGAAQYIYAKNGPDSGLKASRFLRHVYIGANFSPSAIETEGQRYGLITCSCKDIARIVGRMIADGLIVGRFAGRMEWGPRALGNRSILADPRDRTINDILNQRLRRTEFMPFAPSILEPYASEYLVGYRSDQVAARFMTITYDVVPEKASLIPAVVHVDGTARPQVVREEDNPVYYRIIDTFREITGIPLVINTSFNMHEEPIVHSPNDAIRSYLEGAVDVLAIENYLMVNQKSKEILDPYISTKLTYSRSK